MIHKKHIVLLLLILLHYHGSLHAQMVVLPLESRGPYNYIELKTENNRRFKFLFDTGSTNITMDSLKAANAGIYRALNNVATVAGSGGAQKYTVASNQTLKLGPIKMQGLNIVLANLSILSADIGLDIDGIIGYEILYNYIVKLDFDRKQLAIYRQLSFSDTVGYTGIPFEFNKNILIPRFPISITLANGETFQGKVTFDTGNAFPLIVSSPFSKFHHFEQKLGKTHLTTGRGFNAKTTDLMGKIKSMRFNDFEFGGMDIRLTVNSSAEPKDGYLGILGMEVIKRFNVILDYKRRKIYLKPNSAFKSPFLSDPANVSMERESISFLARNKKLPGIIVTPSGLQYKIIREGSGALPTITEKVSLHFTATLVNGKKLWSTYDSGKPWVHHLDKTINGVKEAVLLMPVGSKWKIFIPPALAFGESGGSDLPPGAALVYDLEVIKAEK